MTFEEYVAPAWPRLRRSAWLPTGDWHRAEDLVQTVPAGDQVYPMLLIPGEGQTSPVDRLHQVIDQLTWP